MHASSPIFKVGDRVRFHIGLRSAVGTVTEDRGFLSSGGRQRLYGIRVDSDSPNGNYIELPEDELQAESGR